MRRLARVKCRPQNLGLAYFSEFMFEAVLEGDNLHANFWLGITTQSGGGHPFMLDLDGLMDFGPGYYEKDRYWATTLRRQSIRAGEAFSVTDTDDVNKGQECRYEITEVQILMRDSAST